MYELNVAGNHVMRRRADDWINATHILKVADYDKPARTRILEREVQKGVHEKVQGGYGKYQGTWIPLAEGRMLAERNGVLEKMRPILDFVPGDRSPPPAPKHATAASNRPRAARQNASAAAAAAAAAQQAAAQQAAATAAAAVAAAGRNSKLGYFSTDYIVTGEHVLPGYLFEVFSLTGMHSFCCQHSTVTSQRGPL